MEACFSGPSIALLGTLALAAQGAIIALFVALRTAYLAQIKREQELNADLTEILRPTLGVASSALERVPRDTARKSAR
jgi:hypothetical protein